MQTKQIKSKNKLKPIPETTSCKFMLTKLVAFHISSLEDNHHFLKEKLNWFWDHSDVNDSSTECYFNSLNSIRDEVRFVKKELQKLRYIQKVIKLFPDDELTLESAKDYKESVDLWKIIAQEQKPKKPDSRKVN